MAELPTHLEDFDSMMFDTLINHPDASDHNKASYVYDKLREWLPPYGTYKLREAVTDAATDYVYRFGSRTDRRCAIRKVLMQIKEVNARHAEHNARHGEEE